MKIKELPEPQSYDLSNSAQGVSLKPSLGRLGSDDVPKDEGWDDELEVDEDRADEVENPEEA